MLPCHLFTFDLFSCLVKEIPGDLKVTCLAAWLVNLGENNTKQNKLTNIYKKAKKNQTNKQIEKKERN